MPAERRAASSWSSRPAQRSHHGRGVSANGTWLRWTRRLGRAGRSRRVRPVRVGTRRVDRTPGRLRVGGMGSCALRHRFLRVGLLGLDPAALSDFDHAANATPMRPRRCVGGGALPLPTHLQSTPASLRVKAGTERSPGRTFRSVASLTVRRVIELRSTSRMPVISSEPTRRADTRRTDGVPASPRSGSRS